MSEDDPIPLGKIRLEDAYERVFRALTPEWEKLVVETEEGLSNREAYSDLEQAYLRATRSFQEALSNGELTAYREFSQGERQLGRNDWTAKNGYSPGIVVGVFEPPAGSEPVYFDLTELDKWLKARGRGSSSSPDTSLPPSGLQPERRQRTRPSRSRAGRAIAALYGDAIPDDATLPNKNLCKQINEWLKLNNQLSVGNDTILRAAGRRSN
jgi:hypothetical protein